MYMFPNKYKNSHQRIAGTPSISVYPAGLSITSTPKTDTKSYVLTLSY